MSKVFIFPSEYNEKNWVKLSLKFEEVMGSDGDRELDLSRVEWADPIPLLSLCLILRKDFFEKHMKDSFKKISLIVDLQTKSSGHKRFLTFLNNQGFLREILKYAAIKGSRKADILDSLSAENKIAEFNEPLKYKNTDCIKARIIDLKGVMKKGGLDSLIDMLMDEAVEEVSTTVDPSWSFYRDHAIQKLRHFSSELIENVIEHAYSAPTQEAFAIYARVRSGRSFIESSDWDGQVEFERNNCFLLKNWDEYRANFNSKWIEVFIVDNGDGLLSEIKKWRSDDQEANALLKEVSSRESRPLRAIGHKIFIGGYSKQERPDAKTKMTGLQLVHETLNQKERQEFAPGEFVRLMTGGEVIGGHLPFENAQARGGNYETVDTLLPLGTAFHACIEMSDTSIVLPEAYTAATDDQLQAIRISVAENSTPHKLDLYTVDQRYLRAKGENYDAHRRPTDVLNNKFTKQTGDNRSSKYTNEELYQLFVNNDHKHLVWLPPDSVTKRDIKAWIKFCLFSTLKSLIIADIPLHRARIFEYIASSEEINGEENDSHLNIYIITRNWHVASYRSEYANKKYSFNEDSSGGVSKLGLEKLNQMLRENDSKIFWGNVLTKNNSSFVAEPVIWDKRSAKSGSTSRVKDFVIQGYLDFNEATSNVVNHKIIKAALERTVALWEGENIVLIGIDDLVSPFSSDINTIHNLNYISEGNVDHPLRKVLLVGSTYVTGDTSDRIRTLIRGNYSEVEIDEVYILKHPSGTSGSRSLLRVLDWDGNIKIKKPRRKKYERLEGTPYIKRGGAKSYRIKRNRNPSNPYDMYREFSQGHLKLGHWEYSNSHDLLTPNLSRIIATNPAVTKWFCDEAERLHSDIEIEGKKAKNYLVYISHNVTNKLVDRIRKTNPKLEKLYEIHSLHKLNIVSSQHVFFSPVVLEKIENTSARKVPINVILIDDGVISGTTLRNAEMNLIFNEYDKLATLSIIDRNGFSLTENIQGNEQISRKTYWSWDVPSLGMSGHCRLCHSIDAINALARSIPNIWIKARAKYWSETWKLRPVVDQGWGLIGIPTQLLNQPYEMKFGQPPEPVTHINSTTLSSMSIEISNSSFQPEFPLKKFFRKNDDNKSITMKVSLEVLSTHVLLLGDGLTASRKLEYYSAILELFWKCEYSDQYTALAGLVFVTIEDSLKQLVWREMSKLIHRYGFRYKRDSRLEDLELACLALIVDIPRIKSKLRNEIDKSDSRATEAFLFLLSLVQNREHHRGPVLNYYQMFGSGPGKWHSGRFEESIMNAPEIFSTMETEPRQRIKGVINEAINVVTDLDKYELITHHDSCSVIQKLKNIGNDLMAGEGDEFKNRAYIQNRLIDMELFKSLWEYAQSSPGMIITHVRSEILLFNKGFVDYYREKKEKTDVDEDWSNGGPEIRIECECMEESRNRYAFFKPFRDFIRDAILNSIWGRHGVKADNGDKCSMLIRVNENADFLVVCFTNLTTKDNVMLHSKAYQTKINALDGVYSVSADNGVCTVTLMIPSISNFFQKEVYDARSSN